MAPPILVTGSHRSGTTWVGRTLALDPSLIYVHEPFNVDARKPTMRARPAHWFQHVTRENEGALGESMLEVVRGDFPVRPRSLAERLAERLRPPRVLVKDPIALLAAPWLADRFGFQVVVMLRHPAAFVSSLKRLDWRFDFNDLADQSPLMRELAGPYDAEIRALAMRQRTGQREPDIVDQSILLWNVLHHVIAGYRTDRPDWMFLRNEDISEAPVEHFRGLYERFGLRWTDAIERQVEAGSGEDAPAEVDVGDRNVTVRNSRAARWTWLQRLTPEEQARVREGTREVASQFYAEEDWTPPTEFATEGGRRP
jgi:Sulfotransferase family